MSSKGDKMVEKDSPTSDVEEETETDYSTADETDPRNATLFGNMRTRLRWEADSKTLNLDVRQYVQNRRKLELKYKGHLNTHNGDYQYTAQVQRIMSQNTPSLARIMAAERGMQLEGEEDIDIDRFLPAGLKSLFFKDWTMAPGLRVTTRGRTQALAVTAQPQAAAAAAAEAGAVVPASSSNSSGRGLRYCVTFKKQPQVLWRRGVWDSWLEGKADLELDAAQQSVGMRGALRLKVLRLNLTDKQDLQLSVGADYISSSSSSSSKAEDTGDSSSSSSNGTLTPYVKLSENSWAVRLARGALTFTYDI